MKAFTERRPWIIGTVALAAIAAFTGAALLLGSGFLHPTYTVYAVFSDTAGLQPGDQVLVAGAKAGTVGSVAQQGDAVRVALDVHQGVALPGDSTAAIDVETLLGVEVVRLDAGADWAHLLGTGATITKTTTPTQFLDLQDIATHLLNNTNAANLDQLVTSLAAVTRGKQSEVATIISGLDKLTTTVNNRSTQVSQLIDAADTLSATLASRRQDLAKVIDNLDVVVAGLARRRAQLAQLLAQTEQAASQTADLVGANRAKLDSILAELHTDLAMVGRLQVDLAQFVAYLGESIQGFASINYSGSFPNSWANIFTEVPTLNSVLGACGDVAHALDLALGSDPLPCSQRVGPVATGGAGVPPGSVPPTAVPPAAPAAASAQGAASAPARGATPAGGSAGAPGQGASTVGPVALPAPSPATTASALHDLVGLALGDR